MNIPQNTNLTKASLAGGQAGRLGPYLGGRRGLLVLGGIAVTLGVGLNWSWLAAAGVTPVLFGLLPCAAMCALGLCLPRLMRPNADQQAAPLDMSSNRVPASCTDLPSIIRASADGDCCAPASAQPSRGSE